MQSASALWFHAVEGVVYVLASYPMLQIVILLRSSLEVAHASHLGSGDIPLCSAMFISGSKAFYFARRGIFFCFYLMIGYVVNDFSL